MILKFLSLIAKISKKNVLEDIKIKMIKNKVQMLTYLYMKEKEKIN